MARALAEARALGKRRAGRASHHKVFVNWPQLSANPRRYANHLVPLLEKWFMGVWLAVVTLAEAPRLMGARFGADMSAKGFIRRGSAS